MRRLSRPVSDRRQPHIAPQMPASSAPAFQIHWSLVPQDETTALVAPNCRLLAIWPAPVNHDACFRQAGFTQFGDNDAEWDQAAEGLLRRVLEKLGRYGDPKLESQPLRDNPPWYLRPFVAGRKLPLPQQALWPMQWDSLPDFHVRFGKKGAALRTGSGHFLLWVTLPDAGSEAGRFVSEVAGPWPVLETRLRWAMLLPAVPGAK
jgi:hypothetical protein